MRFGEHGREGRKRMVVVDWCTGIRGLKVLPRRRKEEPGVEDKHPALSVEPCTTVTLHAKSAGCSDRRVDPHCPTKFSQAVRETQLARVGAYTSMQCTKCHRATLVVTLGMKIYYLDIKMSSTSCTAHDGILQEPGRGVALSPRPGNEGNSTPSEAYAGTWTP